ncbi:hypothetical protein [Actinoplanes sp. NBRC 101535]|uniref:hypothetical protein n=1 Tax=Actinoplanes sp. NBRC 101535 TaxID=3032196 RepID=UPI0024A391A9|nr:hypothetical protein [Actinoplanes sp. NBRC 101535]GLY02421.1 hypothetical protein Acsp01_28000 [Actinoplanes sp. NBRC 101535]
MKLVSAVLVLVIVWFTGMSPAYALAEPLPTTNPAPAPTTEPAPAPTATATTSLTAAAPGGMGWQGPGSGIWKVHLENHGAYTIKTCVGSDTTAAQGSKDGPCHGGMLAGQQHHFSVPYTPGDHLVMYLHVLHGPIKRDVDVTGAQECSLSGTVQAAKLVCDSFKAVTADPVPPPTIPTYDPSQAKGSNGLPSQLNLLNLLAWCISAAGVAGLIVIGMQLALQVRRGVPGSMAEIRQEILIVAISCFLAMSAGPIVAFLAIPLW